MTTDTLQRQTAQGADKGAATGGQFLSFALGGEMYAIDILRVQEIRGWEPVRPLPDSPAHLKGVLDLRGTIVPVVDLRVRFSTGAPDYTPTTVVVVVNVRDAAGQARVIGAVVDAVSDVLDITAHDLRRAPHMTCCVSARYLQGMATVDGRMVILLDVDRLFGSDELRALDDLESPAE